MDRVRLVLAFVGIDPPEGDALLVTARGRGFRAFASATGAHESTHPGEEWFSWDGTTLLRQTGPPIRLPFLRIDEPSRLEAILRDAPTSGRIGIRWAGDRVIPLETAVAARRGRFEIWVVTDRIADVPAALGALEHGADRVVAEVRSPADLDYLEEHLDAPRVRNLEWTDIEVTRVVPAGMGERVLVDTTSLLDEREGMLVGSSAAFLFHVVGETAGSRYSRPRPFRVNAGAVHSYCLLPDGSTRYLSELSAGDPVLIAAAGGELRAARIGRVKIERRPMVMIVARDGDEEHSLFLQEAETVRLSGSSHAAEPVTQLAGGRHLLGVRLPRGRHLGVVVEERVIER